MRGIIGFCGLFIGLLCFQVHAETSPQKALTCSPIKIHSQHNNTMVLNSQADASGPTLYLLKNVSKKSLWLDRYTQHPSASAGWASYLRPEQWSALLLDKKELELSCAVIQPGTVNYVNCVQAISVCVPQHVTVNTKRKGSYWLIEDKTWDELLRALAKKGVK